MQFSLLEKFNLLGCQNSLWHYAQFTVRQSVANQIVDWVNLIISKFLILNQKTVETNPTIESSETYRYNEPRIINVEPRRFEIDTSYTTIDNDGTISWNVLPSAPRTDQIGQRNDLGLPVYFPDPITEQRIINVEEYPNETIDDLPTFEQVEGW